MKSAIAPLLNAAVARPARYRSSVLWFSGLAQSCQIAPSTKAQDAFNSGDNLRGKQFRRAAYQLRVPGADWFACHYNLEVPRLVRLGPARSLVA